ncbi:hypothetical protein [Ottowia thiooxydans]|uniref:hypothetical protein n=1 Tax=Ottowia thiooxydans TaxID=219182 RepID=UPI00041BDF1D|nr:hypothetical protein [Ottowia thiooxydans]
MKIRKANHGSGALAACALVLGVLLAGCKDRPAEAPYAQVPASANPPAAAPTVPAAPATAEPAPVAAPQATPQSGVSSLVATEPKKMALSVQGVSAAGATVRVKNIEIGTDATVLDVSISFSNRITNSTMMALTDTFLEVENGARLQIKRPQDNRNLSVHTGETLDGRLVFMGAVPASARTLRLVFNEGNPDDNIVAPGLTMDLPLQGG